MTSPCRPPSCDLLKPMLKECVLPWCQCRANLINDYDHYVECECGISTDGFASPEMAVKSWNSIPRRSELAELLRLVDVAKNDIHRSNLYERFNDVWEYAVKLRKEWKIEN